MGRPDAGDRRMPGRQPGLSAGGRLRGLRPVEQPRLHQTVKRAHRWDVLRSVLTKGQEAEWTTLMRVCSSAASDT